MTIQTDDATVYFTNRTDSQLFDRVRILENGFLHGLMTQSYQQKFYPPREIAEVEPSEHDSPPADGDTEYVIGHGAEVWFTDDAPRSPADTVALLPGGWVGLWLSEYGSRYYPAHRIDSVHTHTNDEQESAGWFK